MRFDKKMPWKYAESVILTSDDTIGAIDEITKQIDKLGYCDFQVTSMESICHVNIIARKREPVNKKI